MHREHSGFQMVSISVQLFPRQICPAAAQGFSQFPDLLRQFCRIAQRFPRRRNAHFVNGIRPALGLRIKQRHGVNGIIPEFNTHRRSHLHREYIQNIPPDRELSRPGDALSTDIAAGGQLLGQCRQVCGAVPAQQGGVFLQLLR